MPQHFSGITALPDKTLLSLDGSVSNMFNLTATISNQFMQMFDLYVVEGSANLADWTRQSGGFNRLSWDFFPAKSALMSEKQCKHSTNHKL